MQAYELYNSRRKSIIFYFSFLLPQYGRSNIQRRGGQLKLSPVVDEQTSAPSLRIRQMLLFFFRTQDLANAHIMGT